LLAYASFPVAVLFFFLIAFCGGVSQEPNENPVAKCRQKRRHPAAYFLSLLAQYHTRLPESNVIVLLATGKPKRPM
jgi:hypothetical protein